MKKMTWILYILLLIYCQQSYGQDIRQGLLAYYPLDNSYLNSIDKNIYNGKPDRKIVFAVDRFKNSNSSVYLDAYDAGAIIIPNPNQLLPIDTTAKTYCFWYNSTLRSHGQTLLVNGDYNTNGEGWLSFGAGTDGFDLYLGMRKEGDEPISNAFRAKLNEKYGNPSLIDGEWHLLALIITQKFARIYLDGIQIFATPIDIEKFKPYNSNKPLIFCGTNFGGLLDDIAIYNRVLSSVDIKKHLFEGLSYETNKQSDFYIKKQSCFKNYFAYQLEILLSLGNKENEILELLSNKFFKPDYISNKIIVQISKSTNYKLYASTPIYSLILNEIEKDKQNKLAQEKQRLLEIDQEKKRATYIKKATVGDMLIYTQDWEHNESYLFGFYKKNTPFKMIIKCFIERIEGEKYQIRIADVSSNGDNYATPEIKGVKIHRGDIIWVKPLQDRNWFWGEDE